MFQYGVDIVDPFAVLYLGYDFKMTAALVYYTLHGHDVVLATYERMGHKIEILLHGPTYEHLVALRYRRQINGHVGNIHALETTYNAVVHYFSYQRVALAGYNGKLYLSVVNKKRGSYRHIVGDGFVSHVYKIATT